MNNYVVVGDADAIIYLHLRNDVLHEKAKKISKRLYSSGSSVIFPNTALIEAITTFQRKLSKSHLAEFLIEQYNSNAFEIEYVDEKMMKIAISFFDPTGSKQNTFFDGIVAACARILSADAIFSFDTFYKKKGFKLASDL